MDNQPQNTPTSTSDNNIDQTSTPQASPQPASAFITPNQTIITLTQTPAPLQASSVTPQLDPTPAIASSSTVPLTDLTPNASATTPSPIPRTFNSQTSPQSTNVLGSPVQTLQFNTKPKRRNKGLFIALVAAGIFVLSSTAAGYFGYIVPNKPENVWKTAMKNMGTAYDTLTKAGLELESAKGSETAGTFSYEGESNISGDFSVKSYDTDVLMQVNLKQEMANTKFELMLVTPESKTVPNLYLKIAELNVVDGLIDETIIDAYSDIVGKWYELDSSMYSEGLVEEDVPIEYTKEEYKELYDKVGESVKEYLFSTVKDDAVLTVQEFIAKEDSFGQEAYKYSVKISNSALAKFENSVKTRVKDTKIGSTLLKDTNLEDDSNSLTDALKESEEYDVWVDKKTKLIQNVRYYDKNDKNTFSEFGQLYQGGDKLPLFFNTQQKSGTGNNVFNLKLDLDKKLNTAGLKATYTQADGAGKFDMSANYKTSNEELKLSVPTDAKSIFELLFGEGYEDDTTSPTPVPAFNTNTLGWNIGLENVNQTNITQYIKNFDSLAKILRQIPGSQIQKP